MPRHLPRSGKRRNPHADRVLIVENDDTARGTIQLLLEQAGFGVSATWSGFEALQLVESGEFGTLLVNDYLPDLYIRDFLERLCRSAMCPCVVLMQAEAPVPGDLRRYRSIGVAAVVDKRDTVRLLQAVSSFGAPKAPAEPPLG